MCPIKKVFANLLVCPILNGKKRRQARQQILDFRLTDFIVKHKFLSAQNRQNSVLLIETNNCHGEVLSGYIQYFQKLGFNIDILINSGIKNENPFCRLNMENVRIYSCGSIALKGILKSKKIMEYTHIFLMSSAYYQENGKELYTSALDKFAELGKHPSLYAVEHDLVDIQRFKEEDLLEKNHLITLGHFEKGVFMCPILFGNTQKNPKNEITTFITIGTIKRFRRNHQALIQAIEKLASENLKFKVIVVGKGKLKQLPKWVRPYIKIMGRLKFPKMFACLECADFFLPLLDADNPEHERYITTGVTGSAQLIYAFSKVPVLHPKFASFYRFDDNNSILATDLADGMRQAIQMTKSEHALKQSALTDLAKNLEKETSNNLMEILK